MHNVEINEVAGIINAAPLDINLMFLGDSGIGKTTVIEDYCKKNGYFLKTLILSQLEPAEALGVPTVSEREFNGNKYKTMKSAIPEWVFELAEHEKALLFLDEFLCAEPSVMNSFLNLLSQKRVQDIDLSHVKFVAASNLGMYTFEPDFNILTRFCFFYSFNSTYDKEFPFIYFYEDETSMEGSIFEPRRLVPRCASSLKTVPTEYLSMFYEGFTNKLPTMAELSTGLRQSSDISMIVYSYATKTPDENGTIKYSVADELLKAMCDHLYKKYARSYKAVIDSITCITEAQKERAKTFH